MLVLTDDVKSSVLGFCNSIKKGGLLVVGDVIIGPMDEKCVCVCMMRTRVSRALNFVPLLVFQVFVYIRLLNFKKSGKQAGRTALQDSAIALSEAHASLLHHAPADIVRDAVIFVD